MRKEDEDLYRIRWARVSDYENVMDMVWETFLKFEGKDYTEEGIRNFEEFIHSDSVYNSFLLGSYQIMVVTHQEEIVAMASVRNRNHLSLLFVKEEYHHKGIGSYLLGRFCKYLLEEQGEKEMTLWAAPYAVGFYQKLGFESTEPEKMIEGIRITTMKKILV